MIDDLGTTAVVIWTAIFVGLMIAWFVIAVFDDDDYAS
ncbi:hypothetical protein SEA_STROSAHL_71 [Gordonia phage Strosahl]|uniref:Uncharacterized protein n=5 Tax=Soupsvirus TaxID=1982562 RepID=A0A160DIZ3_9CAUD|nr:membrane protein [Gordonia phage Rosalind]YP_009269091.1 membrane protein [Gordonia phage KatherineG]YP_009269369.1 membrane protein [Gordonia phage Soups]YP_009281682.1 membrane protein [Gordonia phage Remus]YP_009286011.1 membrane protein [Gordonia phage JSwag]YP_009596272.1 membrane protein [Gordonia phage Strosahl]YP_009624586.1 membrane protein [Gordonia phage Waits]ASZ73947.1 membrane protein [Gordonia phage ShayRa]AXH47867.1 membrane protein [Gordonia phage LastResort]QDM56245.1 